MAKEKITLMDLDGTMSDSRGRGIWTPENSFFWHEDLINDPRNQLVYDLVGSLWDFDGDPEYIIITAKPEEHRKTVHKWLKKHHWPDPLDLYMRPCGNHERTSTFKESILHKIQEKFVVILAVDDRDENCEMFRRNGVPCFHVRYPLQPQTRLL